MASLVKRPGVSLWALISAGGEEADLEHCRWPEIELKYAGYLFREREAADRLAELDDFRLPEELEYGGLTALSFEAREKLSRTRPATIGQAGRIPGVSPSDLQSLVLAVVRLQSGKTGVSRETAGPGRPSPTPVSQSTAEA